MKEGMLDHTKVFWGGAFPCYNFITMHTSESIFAIHVHNVDKAISHKSSDSKLAYIHTKSIAKSFREQPNPDTSIMRHRQIRLLHRLLSRLRIRILKCIEVLHQSYDGVTSLGECILLCGYFVSKSIGQ